MCLVNLISIPEDGGHYLVTKVNIFLTLMYLKKGRIMMSMIMMMIYIECRCERLFVTKNVVSWFLVGFHDFTR